VSNCHRLINSQTLNARSVVVEAGEGGSKGVSFAGVWQWEHAGVHGTQFTASERAGMTKPQLKPS
jgi:hypothetical protein